MTRSPHYLATVAQELRDLNLLTILDEAISEARKLRCKPINPAEQAVATTAYDRLLMVRAELDDVIARVSPVEAGRRVEEMEEAA